MPPNQRLLWVGLVDSMDICPSLFGLFLASDHQKLLQIVKHLSFLASFYKNRFDKNRPKST
jgi:hypothetical protein